MTTKSRALTIGAALLWIMLAITLLYPATVAGRVVVQAAEPAFVDAAPTLGDNLISRVTVATQSGDYRRPLDSTPDPTARTIYFTASSTAGRGVFRVPAAGGAARPLLTGAPFVAPRGILISSDGQWLYVADPQARDGARVGLIFRLPSAGGPLQPLSMTVGTAPQSMAFARQGGRPLLYYTGRNPRSGQPAVFRLSLDPVGPPAVVAEGAPLVAPDGIAVTRGGDLYVTDRQAIGATSGAVFKIAHGSVTTIVSGLRLGNPAGVALSPRDAMLLVSAHQAAKPGDEVLVIDLHTLRTGAVTTVVGQNRNGGGLHGPFGGPGSNPTYSWADVSAPGGGGRGRVYLVSLNP